MTEGEPPNGERAGAPWRALFGELSAFGGAGAVVCDPLAGERPSRSPPGAVWIGVHRGGPLPQHGLERFDILLSAALDAPRPWVAAQAELLDELISTLRAQIDRQPAAAAVAAQILRMSPQLSFDDVLILESLGYSMLLASEGFRAWRAAHPVRERAPDHAPRVNIEFSGAKLIIKLTRPSARNAVDALMRDALVDALRFAGEHPDAPAIELAGDGSTFCAGGDLDEFGRAGDPGWAHMIRTFQAPAQLIHGLGARVSARVHGACVGAGVEISAAASRVVARRGAYFRLPEISMGLIPGAGGTASVARRIGRARACYMAISGADVDLPTALAWGLVDGEDKSP